MTTVMTANTRSTLCVTKAIDILGDDGNYHRFTLTLFGGVPTWTEIDAEPGGLAASNSVNISGGHKGSGVIGTAFYIFCQDDGLYHQFTMEPFDPNDFDNSVFIWTDYSQSATRPTVYRIVPYARADAGLYLKDANGKELHKMSVIGGIFSEETQGVTFPL